MCGGLFGSSPDVPEVQKPPAQPTQASTSVSNAADEERRKRLRAKGVGNSILTSAQGLGSQAPTTNKQLLGQ